MNTKICPNCKVELDENMETCPLCNYPVTEGPVDLAEPDSPPSISQEDNFIPGYEKLTVIQKRKLFWELSGIILVSGIIVTLIIDLVTAIGITWSKYTITVCLVLFANTTLLTFWRNRLLILFGGSFIFSSLLFVLLDMYDVLRIGWAIRLGIPILFSFYLIVLLLTLLVRSAKRKGFNVLAYFFIAVGIFSLCIEGILSTYYLNAMQFSWSLIILVSMIPIAAILSFIHYRLNKGIELKRFFHI